MSEVCHQHAWVPVGHVLRCGDPDCIAWAPLPLPDPHAGTAAVQRPPRRVKPKPGAREGASTTPPSAAAAAGSNVVSLAGKRKAT